MFNRLHVGNLTTDVSANELETLFAQSGEVTAALVVTDHYSGVSRGYGFVEMATPDDTRTAIGALDGCNIGGRELTVAIAKPHPR